MATAFGSSDPVAQQLLRTLEAALAQVDCARYKGDSMRRWRAVEAALWRELGPTAKLELEREEGMTFSALHVRSGAVRATIRLAEGRLDVELQP